MIKLVMIRHFPTEGNFHKRYIGITDEPLSKKGISTLHKYRYPEVEALYSSPLTRCLETGRIIYPHLAPMIYQGLRECDFGTFENKNYIELSENPDYQNWIDSQGLLPFPGGESPMEFKMRCISAFEDVMKDSLANKYKSIALIVHGGTIMSILDKYSYPHQDYYHWQVNNGSGFCMEYEKGRLLHICGIQSSL